MQAVIPCGGRATRLGALAERVPKLLVPVAGRPFAHHKLEQLARAGFREVVLCVGHLGAAIRDALGDGAPFGVSLRYVDEGDRALGTWGALRGAADALDAEVLVTYGDSLLPGDASLPLRALRVRPDLQGVMVVWRNEGALEPSNAAVVGDRVTRFAGRDAPGEAPEELAWIDFGATALRREALLRLPGGARAPLGDLFATLAAEGRLGALPSPGRFYEIGSLAGLRDAEAAALAGVFAPEGGAR